MRGFIPFRNALLVVIGLGPLMSAGLPGMPPEDRAVASDADTSDDQPADYDRSIRPILSDRCFPCHGPDAAARKKNLRFDVEESALGERPSGAAIVAGDPSRSEMIRRLRSTDLDDRMPPPESKLEVSPEEIAQIENWIAEGAPFDRHWAFVAAKPPPLPSIQGESWPQRPLDRFVLSRLEKSGLAPAAEADRTTLARRSSFLLTGLAPELPQLDSFLADEAPDAWERWVDALLDSPAYGERMASHWLDVARYADSYGYQSDVHRPMWQWRDWVIEAFNANLRFDQFITWQVAGDLIDDATPDQRLATAFQRLHRQTNEGGSVEEEFRIEYVADRTQTFATGFLGLTLECARCHDHKFDPIEQREYYALSAFFSNIDESGLYSHFTAAVPTPAMSIPEPGAAQQISTLEAEVERTRQRVAALETSRRGEFDRWLDLQRGDLPEVTLEQFAVVFETHPVDVSARFSFEEITEGQSSNSADPSHPAKVPATITLNDGASGRAIELTGDDAVLLDGLGAFSRSDPFTISLWIWAPEVMERAVVLHRSRAWTDAGSQGYQILIEDGHLTAALIHFWPGDAIAVATVDRLEPRSWTHVVLSYDGSSRASGLCLWVNGNAAPARVVRDHLRSPITGGDPYFAVGERFRDRGFAGGRVDELLVLNREISGLEVRRLFSEGSPSSAEAKVGDALAALYRWWLLAIDEESRSARAELTAARKQLAVVTDAQPRIMVMAELESKRPTHILGRGRYDSPGEVIAPGVPAIFPPLPGKGPPDRLILARWLVSPDHPLTARVAVNRLWQLTFGEGIVATSEDFGTQGARPTHPELLDHLASEFIASGWDVKQMLRQILMSSTWRQSSAASAELVERDPDNRLLARGPTLRMSAEMVRDQALQSSGLLVKSIGGPSVLPYQPAGLWEEKSGQKYVPSTGDGLYRRSLYTFWKRTSPPPTMMIFDASKRDVCVTRRHRTSTPMQSLVLMNDPQFVEAARMLARRVMQEVGDDPAEAIALAFRLLTGRGAEAEEADILLGLYEDLRAGFREDPGAAKRLLSIGESPCDAALDPIDWASMTAVGSLLFIHDETTRLR